jgi:hypothetical protein
MTSLWLGKATSYQNCSKTHVQQENLAEQLKITTIKIAYIYINFDLFMHKSKN